MPATYGSNEERTSLRPAPVAYSSTTKPYQNEAEEEEGKLHRREEEEADSPTIYYTHDDGEDAQQWFCHRLRHAALGATLFLSLLSVLALYGLKARGPPTHPPTPPAFSSSSSSSSEEELRQPEVRRSVNGVLETTFRIVPARVTDGPASFSTRTYEVGMGGVGGWVGGFVWGGGGGCLLFSHRGDRGGWGVVGG